MAKQRNTQAMCQTVLTQALVLGLWGVSTATGAKPPSPTSHGVTVACSSLQPRAASHAQKNPTAEQRVVKLEITEAIANKPASANTHTNKMTAANGTVQAGASDIEGDDGGEVDIDTAIPPNSPTVPTAIANAGDQPLSVANTDIQQVPLGAVSPLTIEKFVKMIDTIRQEYVSNVDDETLFANAMAGTLAALDPYSEYLDAQSFENLRLFTEGDIGSIGVSVSYHPDVQAWVFDEVLANSPAAKAGVQRGNYLHQINDNKLEEDRTQQDVEQLLTGIAGTQVRLVISDKGRRKHMLSVQRTLVQQQAINANIIDGIAVVQIPVFQNNTQQQFLLALAKLDQPFTMIVLDLRNNPGGVLSAANDIASLFMTNKEVVEIKNRQGLQEVMTTHGNAQFAEIPLVVLQNRYSASAAEVLASSLQNNQRAKIYGETSYGKGSIQSIVPLDNDEAIKLTVAHYYSSKGEKIDGIGVQPDVALSGAETTWENQLIQRLQSITRPNQYRIQPTNNPQIF